MSWNYANETGDSAVYETRQALLMNRNVGNKPRSEMETRDGIGSDIWGGVKEVGTDIWGGVKTVGGVAYDYAEAPLKFVDIAEYGLLAIAGLLAFGIFRSLSQSDVSNIGTGVSKVITSAK